MSSYYRISIPLSIILVTSGVYYFIKRHAPSSQPYKLTHIGTKQPIVPVAIIGSGPAGLSAALYTARSALYTVVFEGPKPGGQLTETTYVENWPGTKKMLGSELIDQTKKQAETFGAHIVHDTVTGVDFSS